jgi:hypothetical protein
MLDSGQAADAAVAVADPAVRSTSIDRSRRASQVEGSSIWVEVPANTLVFGYMTANYLDAWMLECNGDSFAAGDISQIVDQQWWIGALNNGQHLTGGGLAGGGSSTPFAAARRPQNKYKFPDPTTAIPVQLQDTNSFRLRGNSKNIVVDAPRVSGVAGVSCPDSRSSLGCVIAGGGAIQGGVLSDTQGGAGVDPVAGGSGQAAIDDVVATGTLPVIAAARLDGAGPFYFGSAGADGGAPPTVTGPAVVLGAFSNPPTAKPPTPFLRTAWVQVLQVDGVIPAIAPASMSPMSDELGFGAVIGERRDIVDTIRVLTFPFMGSLKIAGMPDLTAPAGGYGTALVVFDESTGNIKLAKVFGKGPKSLGRASHARAHFNSSQALPGGFQIVYVDTVWDTITFDQSHVASAKQGGDVVVAILDSTGSPIKVAQYGGPGDDEPLGIDSHNVVFGRSNGPIDFGNGVLKPSPGESMLWFADLSNLH